MSSFNAPEHLLYATTHEWLQMDGDIATVGISDFAQDQLSDVVWVELPEIGQEYEAGHVIATVESVKAAADIYAPVSGVVVEVNEGLADQPEAVNLDPYGSWFLKIRVTDPGRMPALLSSSAYQATTAA